MKKYPDASYVTNPSPVPPNRGISTTYDTNKTSQANTNHKNQDRVRTSTDLEDMDLRPKPETTRTDWAILDPSRHVTVSAETKARWELLRALAGVKKSEDPQTPKLEANLKNPTQIAGPHPYEIVAAQVLQASTAPPSSEPSYGSAAAAGISRRNASNDRRPQPPSAAFLNQAQGSNGSHKLRPLMLPRMVNRSNSGRKTGSSGHVPSVRPSIRTERHQNGTPIPPWQQEVSRPTHQQQSSRQSRSQVQKPFQPPSRTLSELESGLLAAAQVPNTSSLHFTAYSPLAPSAQSNDQGSSAIGGLRHRNQLPTAKYPQGRPQTAKDIFELGLSISAEISNGHTSRRAALRAHLPNPPDTSAAPATPIADKSPEEVLVLLANGDPEVMAFVYTDEGIEWLINSKYFRTQSTAV